MVNNLFKVILRHFLKSRLSNVGKLQLTTEAAELKTKEISKPVREEKAKKL